MCTHIRDERLVSCANRVIGRFCRRATRRARGMADSRYLGFLISGARILTAVTAVQLPDATSLATKEAHDCVAKLSACRDNDICWSCITNYDSLEYQQCIRATKNTIRSTGDSFGCDDFDVFPCCQDDVSEHACT